MKKEPLEVIRGSGNLYRDFNMADADVRQLKAILAAEMNNLAASRGVSKPKTTAKVCAPRGGELDPERFMRQERERWGGLVRASGAKEE